MNGRDFNLQLDRLREGELILAEPGESGLTAYASTNLYELRSYVAALEAGYRAVSGRLAAYRGYANERALGKIVKNQWSSTAALGYAAEAMRRSGLSPAQAVDALERMEELMDEHPRAWASDVYMELIEGTGDADCRNGAEPGADPSTGLEAGPPPLDRGGFAGDGES